MDPDSFGPRLSFQETMELAWLPKDDNSNTHKFVSRMPAWTPGKGLPWEQIAGRRDPSRPRTFGPGAFGGHVYAQAPLAAAMVVDKGDKGGSSENRFGLHSIQGVFTNPGRSDRPFIYEVTVQSSSRSFSTCLINARQPKEPSSQPEGPYPVSDAGLPLGDVCFTCIATFKRPLAGPSNVQEEVSPWKRYADILSSRAPDEWEASPQADIDALTERYPSMGHAHFPILDLYKVDMTAFNASKSVPERRQLILYRLHKPLPPTDPNAHILCHAFEADRNGLLMLGNHLGYGYKMGAVASLSYSFYVHVNAEEAVMDGEGWWIQELAFPRAGAGRGMLESRIWSPEGVHVASGYQDGIVLPMAKSDRGKI